MKKRKENIPVNICAENEKNKNQKPFVSNTFLNKCRSLMTIIINWPL